MQIYANKSHDFLQFSAKITATQANYDMKYVIETLPASFTPTSNGFMEGKSLLVVYGFYFFPTPPSGPPWNEGHRPKVRHETSVLEVLTPGTTRTLLLFKFY